jgi:biotin carboxyl carrier protein
MSTGGTEVRFQFTLDGKEHEVNTGRERGELIIDGQEYVAIIESPAKNRRVITLNERRYELRVVEGEVSEGEFILDLAGELIPVEVSEISLRAVRGPPPSKAKKVALPTDKLPKKAAKAVGGGIRAPMPGRIVEVFVEAGDEVEAGDVVLILEAMKMENELRSPGKAIVQSVNVKPGDSVASNQLLVALD